MISKTCVAFLMYLEHSGYALKVNKSKKVKSEPAIPLKMLQSLENSIFRITIRILLPRERLPKFTY